jgi:flagellar assembly protein FliH
MLTAKRIIREETRTDIQIIGRTIRSALKFVVEKSHIRILINPDDMEAVRELLPDLAALNKVAEFQLTEDNGIKRGGCILETGFGKINATIEGQLEVLEQKVDQEFKSHQEEFHDALS